MGAELVLTHLDSPLPVCGNILVLHKMSFRGSPGPKSSLHCRDVTCARAVSLLRAQRALGEKVGTQTELLQNNKNTMVRLVRKKRNSAGSHEKCLFFAPSHPSGAEGCKGQMLEEDLCCRGAVS